MHLVSTSARRLRRAAALSGVGALWLFAVPVAAEQGCNASFEQGASCPAGAAPDNGAASPSSLLPDVGIGNPVSLVTGIKRQRETDLEIAGAMLGFRRSYDSGGADADIGLGQGWRHSGRYASTGPITDTWTCATVAPA